jgi:hypothetical protein
MRQKNTVSFSGKRVDYRKWCLLWSKIHAFGERGLKVEMAGTVTCPECGSSGPAENILNPKFIGYHNEDCKLADLFFRFVNRSKLAKGDPDITKELKQQIVIVNFSSRCNPLTDAGRKEIVKIWKKKEYNADKCSLWKNGMCQLPENGNEGCPFADVEDCAYSECP